MFIITLQKYFSLIQVIFLIQVANYVNYTFSSNLEVSVMKIFVAPQLRCNHGGTSGDIKLG